jgi:CheY-like chemotaxis protein
MDGSRRILVIDDEEVLRSMLREVLTTGGYLVDTANCGEDGLQLCETVSYDLVLCDNTMPGIDGLGVVARLKTRGVPVILMTGYGSLDVSMRAHALGAVGYLLKPFDEITGITREVERVFGRIEKERDLARRLEGGKP